MTPPEASGATPSGTTAPVAASSCWPSYCVWVDESRTVAALLDSLTTWNLSVQSAFSRRPSIRTDTPPDVPAAGMSRSAPVWSTYRPDESVYTLSHSSCVTVFVASSCTVVSGTCCVSATRFTTW